MYVGLDYNSESIRVCLLSESGEQRANRKVPNSALAVQDLVSQFGFPKRIAIEACCGSADFAEELAEVAEWEVRLAHPGYVRRLKQRPDKSDHDDAYLLADPVRVNYLPEVWLADAKTRALRRLVRYRQQLKRARTDLKLQFCGWLREERVPPANANSWTKAWEEELRSSKEPSPSGQWVLTRQFTRLAELDKEIRLVEQRLEEATRDESTKRSTREGRPVRAHPDPLPKTAPPLFDLCPNPPICHTSRHEHGACEADFLVGRRTKRRLARREFDSRPPSGGPGY